MTNKNNSSQQLLPVGFYDLLFEEALKNHQNINQALDSFIQAGYGLIKTPLVEFEQNFHPQETENSFRVTDIISGKNLIFRNDITLQISRLLSTRLSSQNFPLKLCYVGDVLCAKSEELYVDRQQTQVGCEIIGCDQEKSNLEIIEILLATLKKLQLKDLLITISLPDFLQVFLEEIKLSEVDNLRSAIIKKNISEIEKLAKDYGEIITKIALSDGTFAEISAEILKKINNQNLVKQLEKAQLLADFIKRNFPEIECNFDIFGDDNSSYHQEIVFDVFCKKFSYPIARGGRYKIATSGKSFDAVGATIYMNNLRKL